MVWRAAAWQGLRQPREVDFSDGAGCGQWVSSPLALPVSASLDNLLSAPLPRDALSPVLSLSPQS